MICPPRTPFTALRGKLGRLGAFEWEAGGAKGRGGMC